MVELFELSYDDDDGNHGGNREATLRECEYIKWAIKEGQYEDKYNKTETMFIRLEDADRHQNITIHGECILQIEEFGYLSEVINRRDDLSNVINEIIAASGRFNN